MKKNLLKTIKVCISDYFYESGYWGVFEQLTSILKVVIWIVNVFILQQLFDQMIAKYHNSTFIITILMLNVFLMIAYELLSGINEYLKSKNSYTNMGKKMVAFQKKLGKIAPIEFEKAEFLDKVNIARDCLEYEVLGHFTSMMLQFIFYYSVLMIVITGYLISISPLLLVIVVIAIISAIISQRIQIKNYDELLDENMALKRQCDYYKQTIVDRRYYKETRLLGGFNYFYTQFLSVLDKIIHNQQYVERKVIKLNLYTTLISFVSMVLVIVLLAKMLIDSTLTIGTFVSIFIVLSHIFNTIDEIFNIHFHKFGEMLAQINNYYSIMDYAEVSLSSSQRLNSDIVLEKVTFSYPNSSIEIIKNLNLVIKDKETIAIVGENGSGKTTLSKLLLGLYDSDSGQTNSFNKETLKRSSAVFQNYQRYKMSVLDNVIISEMNQFHSLDSVKKLLSTVDFNTDILLDTMLAPEFSGIDLSSGQWQRLSIARGMCKSHQVIILDEPSSAIDPIEEVKLFKLFEKITKNKTSIIVTHRLGSVKFADKIIVMNNGSIVEIGNHKELLLKKGYYYTMWNTQRHWYYE